MRTPAHLRTAVAVGATLVTAAVASPALAQGEDDVTDIEVPTIVLDDVGGTDYVDEGDDIDLANIVQSAARAVTTVQEAPAIVTVITAEEIRDRHVNTIGEAIDVVPGYLRLGVLHSQFPFPLGRGQIQASQFLHDGVSLFEPFVNVPATNEIQPLELIKRVEVITGPGGVLWGSNSLVGIINVITKDAEDVDGVEVGVQGGSGAGNPEYLHGYVMAGKTELFSDDSSLLVHGGFKTFRSPLFEMPQHIFSSPLPQPNSPVLYGPMTQADPDRTFMFTLFAKLKVGKAQLRVMAPFMERYLSMGFPGDVVVKDNPQDDRPECAWDGTPEDLIVPGDGCYDKGKASRDNRFNFLDRYAVLEYQTRLAGGKAGLSAKAYGVQFLRDSKQIQVLTPIEGLLEGGLAFDVNYSTYRGGAQVDGDVELGKTARMLYGVEGFHEFTLNDVTESRQGDGIEARFIAPYDVSRLPLPCPIERNPDDPTTTRFKPGCPLTFAFPSSRTVFGAYVAPQVRPIKKLILDGGARVQVSPEALGENFYDPTVTFAGSAVYNFLPAWHAKVNYAQGFRPPVFNNLNSNGEAVQLDGARDLEVETTQAIQGEINARLFKGQRRIRELNFRVDYSYTLVRNLVQISGGRYENAADRGINSVEFLGKLYIQGGHRIELGYTYLGIDTADRGKLRQLPEHWFNLHGVFNVIDDKLHASTNMRVIGAMEDANRLVEHRILHYCTAAEQTSGACMAGDVVNTQDPTSPWVTTLPTGLVMDRLPPTAELSIGVTYTPSEKLTIEGSVFNAINGRFYQADAFADYEPRLEFLPNPLEDIRAYVGATYSY